MLSTGFTGLEKNAFPRPNPVACHIDTSCRHLRIALIHQMACDELLLSNQRRAASLNLSPGKGVGPWQNGSVRQHRGELAQRAAIQAWWSVGDLPRISSKSPSLYRSTAMTDVVFSKASVRRVLWKNLRGHTIGTQVRRKPGIYLGFEEVPLMGKSVAPKAISK
jgi:hypothetical protein